jgi:cytoskeletal protein RodZ
MQKYTLTPPGQEPAPSLLAASPHGISSERDEAEAPQGILDVVGDGHRPRKMARPWGRWAAFASMAALGLLGWGWWTAMPSVADGAGEGKEATSAAPMPLAPAERPVDAIESAATEPASEAARIEQVEPHVQAQAPTSEELAHAQRPAEQPLASAPARVAGSNTRSAATRAPGTAPSRPRAVTTRTPDPDVEVIEVLLSRTAAVPASASPVAARHP